MHARNVTILAAGLAVALLIAVLVARHSSPAVPSAAAAATATAGTTATATAGASLPSVPPPSTAATTSDTTPPGPLLPDVVGMYVDRAKAVLSDGGCFADQERVVNRLGTHVGQVLAQRPVSDACEIELTVSAGPPRGATGACMSLRMSAGRSGVGAGNFGIPVVFRNAGTVACTLAGYPRVTARKQGTRILVEAHTSLSGYIGGTYHAVPPLVLLPGDVVSALLDGTDNPIGNATSCPVLVDFLVTAGLRTASVRDGPVDCSGMWVHPFVPGLTGSAP